MNEKEMDKVLQDIGQKGFSSLTAECAGRLATRQKGVTNLKDAVGLREKPEG